MASDSDAELKQHLATGEVDAFVGAGMSLGAGLPDWYTLISELAERIGYEMPPRRWATGDALIDTAQAYVNRQGLHSLISYLKDRLDVTRVRPTAAHRALAQLPLSLVFTANFDDLLERTFQDAGRRVEVVVRDSSIPFMRRAPETVNIVKLYGDLDQPDTIVLARQQYERYFLERPQLVKLLETELARSDMLYLGWSHSDPHFNLVFGELLGRYAEFMRPGYAAMFDAPEVQRQELARKHIQLVELPPGDDRTARLASWLAGLAAAAVSLWPATFPPGNLASVRIVEPPRPLPLPDVHGFVGREREIERLLETLRQSHRLGLTGLPGAGKTWLAAALANRSRSPDAIFWHSFRPDEDGSTLVWRLAGFLYWHGRQDLWLMLQGAGPGDRSLPPMDLMVDYLAEWLPKGDYLLCLDDFQDVDEDPLVGELIDRLMPAVDAGTLSLLLTSRRVPPLRDDLDCEPVEGLTLEDAGSLLVRRDVVLPADLLAELHGRTEGNPEALGLATKALNAGADPRRLIPALEQADSVMRYLVDQVDRRLSEAERDLLEVIALLGACTREAVEALSEAPRVAPTLRKLQEGYLLHVVGSDVEREYDLHALLRPYYLDLPSAPRRTSLHVKAGAYYARKNQDLRAASHFLQAGQLDRAALLATQDVWGAVNAGQLHVLRQVLVGLIADSATTARWPGVWSALGQVYALLRETSAAQQALEQAYALLDSLPDSADVREQKAIICRHMGELLKPEAPREALEWLNRGLAAASTGAGDSTDTERERLQAQAAALHVEAGSVYLKLGEFPAGLEELEQGLAMLPEGPSVTRAVGLINLGIVYCTQGKTAQGVQCYWQSIEMSQQFGDLWRVQSARHNLGIEMELAGEWEAASQEYRQALALAEKLGSRRHRAEVALSLGILEMKRGNDQDAAQWLTVSLELTQQAALLDALVAARSSLAQLELRGGSVERAGELLAAAEALALELEARDQLPEIWREQAELALATGLADEALAVVERSIELARQLELDLELGMSLRVQGQIHDARGENPGDTFEESLSLLHSLDPYEAARTELRWGQARLRQGDPDAARELLESASAVFQKLGARRDRAEVEAILGGAP